MSESEQSGAGRREVAYRLFAAEFDDADYSYSESDEERAPNYVITPTGARVNRLFVVGVLTEVEAVSEDVLRARVVDPTGAFVLYAGQYQPDEQAFLDGARTPMFVALTGKARTFQPEDSDQIFTSVRPETISEVDAETRDRWTVQTAEQTVQRVGHMATALSLAVRDDELRMTLEDTGVDDGLAAGIPLAIDHYGTTGTYLSTLHDLSRDAARVVAGELDEVAPLSLSPGDGDDADLQSLADSTVEASVSATDVADAAGSTDSETSPPSQSEATTDAATVDTTETEAVEAPTAAAGGAESGVSETATVSGDESESADEDIGDFEPGEFDLDEDEREEIEEEYGTEFQSGTDVADPGEADIDTPDPEELAEQESERDADSADVSTDDADSPASEEPTEPATTEPEPTETPADDADAEQADVEDVDLEDATVEVMSELDEGTGADRGTLVAEVADRYGADPEDVENAIQDALMGGRCYEPDDTTVKPI